MTFVDDVRAAVKAADLPAMNQAACAAAEQTTLAADDLRRSLPAIRGSLEQLRDLERQLQEQPEPVVYGPRPGGQMIHVTQTCLCRLVCLTAAACQLKRPDTIPNRTLEPQLVEPQLPESAGQETSAANAAPIRLLDIQARGHIGRRLIYQEPGGDPTLAAPLLAWHVGSAGETRLVGAVEFEFIGTDRGAHTQVVRAREPVSADPPGDLAASSGLACCAGSCKRA